MLLLSYISLSGNVKKALPKIEINQKVISKDEYSNCSNCGSEIHFKSNQIGCLCNYCGTETYRVKLSSLLLKKANKAREKAGFSLVKAMEDFNDAVETAIMGPIFITFCLVVLSIVGLIGYLLSFF